MSGVIQTSAQPQSGLVSVTLDAGDAFATGQTLRSLLHLNQVPMLPDSVLEVLGRVAEQLTAAGRAGIAARAKGRAK